jgi:hypothetical protein
MTNLDLLKNYIKDFYKGQYILLKLVHVSISGNDVCYNVSVNDTHNSKIIVLKIKNLDLLNYIYNGLIISHEFNEKEK